MQNAPLILGESGVWTQVNRRHAQLIPFLQAADMSHAALEAIDDEQARPRFAKFGGSEFLLNLKLQGQLQANWASAVATLRLWVGPEILFSFQGRELPLLNELRSQVDEEMGVDQVLWLILDQIGQNWSELVENWDEECDRLEDLLLRRASKRAYASLQGLRSQILVLRKHMIAQKGAIRKLCEQMPPYMLGIRYELQEHLALYDRLVVELEHLRERAQLLQEERENRQTEKQNRQLFMLTLLSAIFLPLTFATGLLGVNIKGIPFAERPWAFGVFCLSLLLLLLAQLLFFRYKRWWT